MAEKKEDKEKLDNELQEVDKQVGDDQSKNPRRDKFTSLYGEKSQGSNDSTTSTTSTPKTTQ